MCRRSLALSAFVLIAGATSAQEPRFEVASVTVHPGGSSFMTGGFCMGTDSTLTPSTAFAGTTTAQSAGVSPGTCQFRKTTLREIIAAAYDVPRSDIHSVVVGGPGWLDDDFFDLDARADGRRPQSELERMLQHLLAARFGLQLHRETRQVDGFALRAARGGPKMTAADSATSRILSKEGTTVVMNATATTMERLATLLARRLRKPVVDETGLPDAYTFTLTWVSGQDEFSPALELILLAGGRPAAEKTAAPTGPSLYTALEEQLGLRLERRTVPVPLLIVDAVHPPTPN